MSKTTDTNATLHPDVQNPDEQEIKTISQKKGLDISAKSFIASILLIFGLMVVTYILTLVIPGGEFTRVIDENGNEVIDQAAGFTEVEGGIPFWQWLLSPILVLGSSSGSTLIAITIFLIVVGGIFNSLDKCGLMRYALDLIAHKFGHARYKLMAIVVLYFMADGSLIGCFEECVPLVPIVVALAVSLGWDKFTGLGMSLLAVCCGFASGISNPFTVGVAQSLAGLPMFSGAWLRIVSFVLIYVLLMFFLTRHAKKIERPVDSSIQAEFTSIAHMNKALLAFVILLGIGIITVMISPLIPVLQDYTMIIVALAYLIAGITAVKLAGTRWGLFAKHFGNGVVSLLPAIAMILMASSIRYTLEEAKILDTILYEALGITSVLPSWSIILFIYLFVLIMNFFVPSGSAKAFMLMPIIIPMAQLFGLSSQLCVLAFAFGDGFSNMIYPTNPVLLISLGLAGVSYGAWMKWTWKYQLANLVLTCAILLFGLAIGY